MNSLTDQQLLRKALEGLPELVKAFKYFDVAPPAGADAQADDHLDHLACLLYGALNLDQQQFDQVYSLMQKYEQEAKQKGLTETNSAPEKAAAVSQMVEQFKAEVPSLLTPEQSRIFAEVLTRSFSSNPGKSSINFSF